ncbi:uncharacterized protein LOC119276689 isoform X3 [Triticum dicoccoides]|uniref:uncharacterized protein LOC119276689 isoform X3 n=1 Tax=Triticum dicoccoides TaxID=85692 RepID=UPI000E7D07A9|nr:uncharacterized protein LOC119276689 isoform X3 [Triticum dicoccoides]
MDISRTAFRSTGRTYPAQVCFNIVWKCRPLTEDEFFPAIEENYYISKKFYFDLSYQQCVRMLNSVCACSTGTVATTQFLQMWHRKSCPHVLLFLEHAEAGDVSCPVRQPPQSASAPTSSPLGLPPPSCSMALSGQVSQIDSDGSMRV